MISPLIFITVCPFSATISLCVDQRSSGPGLCTSALHFLSVVLSEEAKRRDQEVTGQLTPDRRSRLAELLNGTPGEQLCELLLQVDSCFAVDHKQ